MRIAGTDGKGGQGIQDSPSSTKHPGPSRSASDVARKAFDKSRESGRRSHNENRTQDAHSAVDPYTSASDTSLRSCAAPKVDPEAEHVEERKRGDEISARHASGPIQRAEDTHKAQLCTKGKKDEERKCTRSSPAVHAPLGEETANASATRLRRPWGSQQVSYPPKEGEKRSNDAHKKDVRRCTRPRALYILHATKERRPALQRVSDIPGTFRDVHIHPKKKKKTKKAAQKTKRPPLIHQPQTPSDGSQTPQRATDTSKTPRRTIKAKETRQKHERRLRRAHTLSSVYTSLRELPAGGEREDEEGRTRWW
ncbi:hypothetical protein DFH08DRAFT_818925 [Mycena albidolilacea]|uniref:Uncharacterized protein n=1 Tax=Mycena albidolilacea TaxID=1033008 RepID=A0AAD6ZFX8_9AGAR|nr:hypothetical protein DFH08DRAFT_818925 [Mycena albidolilacea]